MYKKTSSVKNELVFFIHLHFITIFMIHRLEKLVTKYTQHFQENSRLSPLQAKILAYIFIYGAKNDITFEQIIEYCNASKSSVSTSLNFLREHKKIIYINKPNDRKKYYKINRLLDVLQQTQKTIVSELDLLDDVISYFDETAEKSNDFIQVNNLKILKEYLEQVSIYINNTLNKIQ